MKIVSAVLGVALVAVGGLAIHLSRQVEAGRRQIASLETRLQDQQAQLDALAARRLAGPATAALPAAPAAPPAAASGPSTQAAAPTAARAPLDVSALLQQMSSPEAVARRRQTTRQLMSLSNPDLDEALGLTPKEVDSLLDLLASQQERNSAVFDQARQSGDPAARQQVTAAALQENRQASEAELQELLGTRYPQWQDYQQTRTAWAQRRDLRAVLDAAGTPMTEAQEQSLIAALSAEQRSFEQTRTTAQPFTQNTPERQQRRLTAAAPHLSAQQLESYRAMLDRAATQEQALLGPLREAAAAAAAAAAERN